MVEGCTTSAKTNSITNKENKYRNVIIEFLIVSLVTLYLGSCSPVFIVGKLSLATNLMLTFYVLNFLVFNRINVVTISLSASLFLCFTVVSLGCAMVTKTEYYTPKQIIRNNSKVIFVGENMVLVDTTINMYNSKNSYLCKDIQTNGFKLRIGDYWYVCEKNKK